MKKYISVLLAIAVIAGLILAAPAATAADRPVARPTASIVLVDGISVPFDAYTINNNNYLKLRDIAYVLRGTQKQFEVVWSEEENAIILTSETPYTINGGEMTAKGSETRTPSQTNSTIYLDGAEVEFAAYNIGGNNYFKLRDIGRAINFSVEWDAEITTIVVDTSKPYREEISADLVLGATTAVPAANLLSYFDLTSQELLMYDALSEGIANFELRVIAPWTPRNEAEVASLSKVCNTLYYTRPDIFWWDAEVRYANNGNPADDGKISILPVYIVDEVKINADMYGAENRLELPPQEQIEACKGWIAKGKADVRAKLSSAPLRPGMTAYEMELAVYEWLGDILNYDGSSMDKHEFNTIHGALVDGNVDCTGYARTLQYVLCLLGIDSLAIEGALSNGVNHLWTALKLDGQWYYADMTEDGTLSDTTGLPWHLHFNRTEEYLLGQGYRLGIPGSRYVNPQIECTSVKYCYYVVTNSIISSDEEFKEKIPALAAKARDNGDAVFEFVFAKEYAVPSDIMTKQHLVAGSDREGYEFWYYSRGVVFGVFE